MARILVTGGAGFVGAALVEALAARGDEVAVFDLGATPALARLLERFPRLRFFPGDLVDWPGLLEAVAAVRPETVVHCAALVGIAKGVASPIATMRVNVEGALAVFAAMRLFDVPRLVNLSSEEIYGPFAHPVIDETHPCRPVKPYGISKYAVEQLARDFAQESGKEVLHVRTCWVYGPGLPRARVPKTLLDAAIEGRSLHLAGGADYRVDQIYVDDLVDGMLRLMDHRDHRHDAYHLTTGEAPSLGEAVDLIRRIVPGADLAIAPGPFEVTPGVAAVRKGALDCTRAREAFGFSPRYDLGRGFEAYVAARRAGA